jgi:hypothetical protein
LTVMQKSYPLGLPSITEIIRTKFEKYDIVPRYRALSPDQYGRGSKQKFLIYVSLILVATFSIFAKSLLTSSIVHAPQCHGTERLGFLKARRSWEPSSSITTGKFSPFRFMRKASAVNVG